MTEKKVKILIVEDEKLTALVIQKKLENLGYTVCGSVMRGEDAINEASISMPNIVLMDINLKGKIDGIEAARIIKDNYNIPIIYVTAYSDNNTVERAKLTNPLGYLIKPVNEKDLITTIEIALYKHKTETEIKQSREQLRELTAKIEYIREEERKNISREIHDELGQMLTCLKIDAIGISKKLDDQKSDLKKRVGTMIDLVDTTISTVRRISSELRPSILDDLGLIAAIEWQAKDFQERTNINCNLDIPFEGLEMDTNKSTQVFRIFQETLTNIARHSDAGNVNINLYSEEDKVNFVISDDGKGMPDNGHVQNKSLGILGMKERAISIGGELNIESSNNNGTTVKLIFPKN